MNTPVLQLKNITKSFEGTTVLQNISLEIESGKFVTLLGASGCGKTTTLRILAGLETPDSGQVFLHGTDITSLEPNKRDMNMVFQNYALFPHMTVEENIGYSLKLKKQSKTQIKQAVENALQLVQLEGYGKRTPAELSGGQRQRVAIARAVVNNPSVLLLDEPLGALDLQLRRQMQTELKKLQKQLGITFIYITHDQEEAINMSDIICVRNEGRFEQIGSPAEIYDHPQTAFVARFVGEGNILHGTVRNVHSDGTVCINTAGGHVAASCNGQTVAVGDAVTFAVRSEQVQFNSNMCENGGLYARVIEKTFAGGMLRIALQLSDGTQLIASRHGIDADFKAEDAVTLCWSADSAVLVKE